MLVTHQDGFGAFDLEPAEARHPAFARMFIETEQTPNPATLNVLSGNVTHHLHGTPVAWLSTAHGQMHFCGGENGNLRAWSLNQAGLSTYLACGSAVASAESALWARISRYFSTEYSRTNVSLVRRSASIGKLKLAR